MSDWFLLVGVGVHNVSDKLSHMPEYQLLSFLCQQYVPDGRGLLLNLSLRNLHKFNYVFDLSFGMCHLHFSNKLSDLRTNFLFIEQLLRSFLCGRGIDQPDLHALWSKL